MCPVCLSTELNPQNQCTLRCGHALCNLCLPQLLSPNCPLCRRSIWNDEETETRPRHTPWLLETENPVLLNPTHLIENNNNHDITSLSTEDSLPRRRGAGRAGARIPVMLLTRAQLRRFFRLEEDEDEED